MLYLGLDGGGTGSRLMACDRAGNLFGPWKGGPTNLRSNPPWAVRSALSGLLDQFGKETGAPLTRVAGVCVGSAGVDRPGDREPWLELLRSLGLRCPALVVSDVEIVLEGETGGAPGLVLIAGTGSLAYGRNGARTHRCGGWGHLLGDEGSGYWIGREALRRCLRSADGREPPTALHPLLESHFRLGDLRDALERVYAPGFNKAELAALSPLVDRAAEQGDLTALDILQDAADQLSQMARTVARSLDLPKNFHMIVSGGILRGSTILMQLLRAAVMDLEAGLRPVSREPCLGALLMARRLDESP